MWQTGARWCTCGDVQHKSHGEATFIKAQRGLMVNRSKHRCLGSQTPRTGGNVGTPRRCTWPEGQSERSGLSSECFVRVVVRAADHGRRHTRRRQRCRWPMWDHTPSVHTDQE